ncbi:MAG: glycoside hydrolase family 15 protein [Planctomycetaceae bacterium]
MDKSAFGYPGLTPRWTRSDKDAIVTAYSTSSPVWATVSAGIINEVYYPSIDSPQIRDLQFLVTDGETFFHDERRHTQSEIVQQCTNSLGYRIVSTDVEGRYSIEKQVITAPHAPCVLIHVQFTVAEEWKSKLRLFALLAPHLNIGGQHNDAFVRQVVNRGMLTAHCGPYWLAADCSSGFNRCSAGYVGASDGWTDLRNNFHFDWEFYSAIDGNVALTGEVNVPDDGNFTFALSFGSNEHNAIAALTESLSIPFAEHRERFQSQWARACIDRDDALVQASNDKGNLFRVSHSLLLAHEDKTCHGAIIASLSIPWGEVKGDDDLGGYHLVWTRDLVNSATGLMASGELSTPLRALIYLASAQLPDGGFFQNFWIDGRPYWQGVQLDEVAFPILLAWRLKQRNALQLFDPYPMVKAAAGYLVRSGPATPQERWEENAGYSPSTLAAHISALICASEFASERGDQVLANYLLEYADFLEQHLERWTVTTQGTVHSDVNRHYIRILPIKLDDPHASEDPNTATLTIRNRPADVQSSFPAKDVVDAGFLELVRYGIRPANDPLVVDSLKVVDTVLKVNTPFGPCWRRYSYDGYGQRADGGPYCGIGQGRAWPLLTGERAHYELAAGNDVDDYVRALEHFAGPTGMLPEQIWDEPDLPEARMWLGKPTGSAMPLMWAHAEYIKLLRSVRDGVPADRIDPVYQRYCNRKVVSDKLEIWKFNRQLRSFRSDEILRIQLGAAFHLIWTDDEWASTHKLASTCPGEGIHFVDLPKTGGNTWVEFTIWWCDAQSWEGRNFGVECVVNT